MSTRVRQMSLLVCIGTIWGPSALAQTESDMIEAAKLGVIEKLQESAAATLRVSLVRPGQSDAVSDNIVYAAYDELAGCLVEAARAQAREQGIPDSVVLKGIGDTIYDEAEAKLFLELDSEALHVRESACNAAFDAFVASASGKRD